MILACSLGIAFQAVAEPEKAATEKRTVSDGKEIRIDPSTVTITGETDKSPLSYAPGEPMVFTLRLHFKGPKPTVPYFIAWRRSGDDGKQETGRAPAFSPVVIRTSLDRPGFVRIYAKLIDGKNQNVVVKNHEAGSFNGGAAVQAEKLKGTPAPADFDAFWEKQKARLAAVPIQSEMKKVVSGKDADIYMVKVDCAGPRPVTGYLSIPHQAAEKSLPAEVVFDGYGFSGIRDLGPASGPKNRLRFKVNAHGYDLRRDKSYYDAFLKKINPRGKGYAFDPEENSNPETAYFNGMALRVIRALEFVKTLPQWNGKTLMLNGGSQGGLQTIWGAALDKDVTSASAAVPWCCDLAGATRFGRLTGGWRLAWTEALEYYDPIHFASKIRCRFTIPRAGLGDYVCPPSGIAVFYNNLTCPKRIIWFQGSTHGRVPKDPQKVEWKHAGTP